MFAIFIDHRMAGVITSLKADHHIHRLRQIVDDAALALITPLRAYNRCYRHNSHLIIHEIALVPAPLLYHARLIFPNQQTMLNGWRVTVTPCDVGATP